MTRFKLIQDQDAQGTVKELLAGAQAQIGMVPNMFRAVANSPAAFESYMLQSKTLSQGELNAKQREQIALTAAGANSCNYCASAHTALGQGAGIPEAEIKLNLSGKSEDANTQAMLNFTQVVMESKGNVSDSDLKAIRDAGFSDGAITEIVSHVAGNIFTNYFNNIVKTEIDFPVVETCSTSCSA